MSIRADLVLAFQLASAILVDRLFDMVLPEFQGPGANAVKEIAMAIAAGIAVVLVTNKVLARPSVEIVWILEYFEEQGSVLVMHRTLSNFVHIQAKYVSSSLFSWAITKRIRPNVIRLRLEATPESAVMLTLDMTNQSSILGSLQPRPNMVLVPLERPVADSLLAWARIEVRPLATTPQLVVECSTRLDGIANEWLRRSIRVNSAVRQIRFRD